MRTALAAAVSLACLAAAASAWADEAADAALLDAARAGDEAAALASLKDGANAEAATADGTTALHWAALMGEGELTRALLRRGADPLAVNDYNTTPLAAAAERADPEVIKALLRAGADPESPNADGQTALMVAARAGDAESVRLLIDAGADVNAQEQLRGQTALMWAATHRRPEIVALLLEEGADPDIRSFPTFFKRYVTAEPRAQYRPHGGMAAAHFAGREGCTDCMRALMDAGADPDIGDYKAITPLIIALENLHFETARVLIEAGADPDKWDRYGRSPLYMAVDMNQVPEGGRPDIPSADALGGYDIAKMLLEAGADPNPRLKAFPPYRNLSNDRGCDSMLTIGTTPLVRAAKVGDAPSVQLLLEHGADYTLETVNGITPVMAAAGLKSIECDIRGGRSYLHEDAAQKQHDALKLLIDAGAEVNEHEEPELEGFYASGASGTPLHGAAFWGWMPVVQLLVENGAKIDALDGRGRSPIDSAMGRAGGHERGGLILVFEDVADYLRTSCEAQADCEPVENIEAAEN